MNQGAFVLTPGWSFRLMTVITLTAGTAFLMWLGEQITERGIGNGISLIIFAGIVARLPSAVAQTFNLYEISVDAPANRRQLTRTTGGATWPDVSPDGTMIVFVGYTSDGFDLFQMPYPRRRELIDADAVATSQPMSAASAGSEAGTLEAASGPLSSQPTGPPPGSTAYMPWGTLVPVWWSPILIAGIGTMKTW